MTRGERQGRANNESSINVAIRLRPINDRESLSLSSSSDERRQRRRDDKPAWRVIPETNSIEQVIFARPSSLEDDSSSSSSSSSPTKKRRQQRRRSSSSFFTFDGTFDEKSSNKDVYDGVARDIVDSIVTGINGTIFAYGQTSSGKSYTMRGNGGEGRDDEEGIIQMAGRDIFTHVSKNPDREYLVRASFLEIYNERVRDLLSKEECTAATALAVREDPKRGVVVNCKEVVVTDLASLLNVLREGEKHRQVAFTDMNATSSRSHTIFRVTVESREAGVGVYDGRDTCDDEDGTVLISTLNLVDLAGSESVKHTGATGDRQREGGMINQSLLSLSQVISALASSKNQFVNYRNSKLTRLLQPALSGNALMSVICCVTPSRRHVDETKSTLQFASRAKLVKTTATKNQVIHGDGRAVIESLQRELKRLRNEMERQQEEFNERRQRQRRDDVTEKFNVLKSMILNAAFLEAGDTATGANKRTRADASLGADNLTPRRERPKKCKRLGDDMTSPTHKNDNSHCRSNDDNTFRYDTDHYKVSFTFCSPTRANQTHSSSTNNTCHKPNPIILFSTDDGTAGHGEGATTTTTAHHHPERDQPPQNSSSHSEEEHRRRAAADDDLTSENARLKEALASNNEQIAALQRELRTWQWDATRLKDENDELRESLADNGRNGSSTTTLVPHEGRRRRRSIWCCIDCWSWC